MFVVPSCLMMLHYSNFIDAIFLREESLTKWKQPLNVQHASESTEYCLLPTARGVKGLDLTPRPQGSHRSGQPRMRQVGGALLRECDMHHPEDLAPAVFLARMMQSRFNLINSNDL
jgi:hypothetical protein